MRAQSTDRSYAQTLRKIVRELVRGRSAAIADGTGPGQGESPVAMFISGNRDKRFDKLRDQVELLADGIPDLDDLIREYIVTVPLAAYDTGSSDGDRFVQWLLRRREPTPEQKDRIAVIRSRHAIEETARFNRLLHVRFQERRSMNERLRPELETNPALRLYLNPIRLVTHFESGLFSGDAGPGGADVVFFAAGTEIHVVSLDDDGHRVMHVLAEQDGLSLAELKRRVRRASGVPLDDGQLMEIVVDSAELGLIALG